MVSESTIVKNLGLLLLVVAVWPASAATMPVVPVGARAAHLTARAGVEANAAPIVSAGNDTTTRLGRQTAFRLRGTVSDDGLPNPTTEILWSQVGGPAGGALIGIPSSLYPSVTFSTTGTYAFRLTASDGELSASDDVSVEVLDSVPFAVLTPRAGDRVTLGSPCLVTWQVDPPGTEIVILLSTDDGLNYEYIMPDRTPSTGSWVWNVPTSLPVSDACVIMVRNYRLTGVYAESGRFTLYRDSTASAAARMAAPPVSKGRALTGCTADGRLPAARSSRAGRGVILSREERVTPAVKYIQGR